jgi:hypothetical protein
LEIGLNIPTGTYNRSCRRFYVHGHGLSVSDLHVRTDASFLYFPSGNTTSSLRRWVGLKIMQGCSRRIVLGSLKVTLHFAVMALPASLVLVCFGSASIHALRETRRTCIFCRDHYGCGLTILWMLIQSTGSILSFY